MKINVFLMKKVQKIINFTLILVLIECFFQKLPNWGAKTGPKGIQIIECQPPSEKGVSDPSKGGG